MEAREKIGIEPMKKIVDSYGGFPTKAEPKLHWTEARLFLMRIKY